MLRKLKPGSAEFKAGVFIILSLALLVFSILWLRYFAISPEKRIIARFKDPGPVESGIPVYYQGVNVGRVPKVGFSKDFKYTYVYIDIYNKELELPANVNARVKIEGIAGQKYVCISYPKKPVDRMLASGDIIEGESPFGLDDVQDFFKREFESGRFQKAIKDFETSLANADKAAIQIGQASKKISLMFTKYDKDIDGIIKSTSGVTEGLNKTITGVNRVVDSPEIQKEVREAVSGVHRIVQNTEAGTEHIFGDIESTQIIKNTNTTVQKAFQTMDTAEDAFKDGGKAARRFDCIGRNVSQMLNQRFLLFKLMFSNPGKPLGECQGQCCQ